MRRRLLAAERAFCPPPSPPTHDSQEARIARQRERYSGFCGRCGWPWTMVRGHSTSYSETSGCFPLCELCWSELDPDSRLPYYYDLMSDWARQGCAVSDETKDAIVQAVLEGK